MKLEAKIGRGALVLLALLAVAGVASAQESGGSFWTCARQQYEAAKAEGTEPSTETCGDSPFAAYFDRLAAEERQSKADALIQSIEAMRQANEMAAQRAQAEAARKAYADAQFQQHLQQMADRRAWEWQNQLWLWEAQRQSQAQQQYQQQLLQTLHRQDVGRQWFQRDLVRAIEGLAPPASCWYSYIQKRHVCY